MNRFPKHISYLEYAAAGVLLLFFLLAAAVQLFFGGGALPLLFFFGIGLALFAGLAFLPESYEITEDALLVDRKLFGRRLIPFQEILQLDVVGNYRFFKRDFDSAEVIVRYRPAGKKRVRSVSCHPEGMLEFVRLLQEKCPNLIPE